MLFVTWSRGLRFLKKAAKFAAVVALVFWFANHLPQFVPQLVEEPVASVIVAILLAVAIVFGSAQILRPVFRAASLWVCNLLVRSGVATLMDCGIFGLLMFSVPSNPIDLPDYQGLATLHEAFEALDTTRQAKIVAAVKHIEEDPGCPCGREAVMFLETTQH